MADTHKRWFCHGCKREWIVAGIIGPDGNRAAWPEGGPCPVCGGVTEQIMYTPSVRGGDIPRKQEDIITPELPMNDTDKYDQTETPIPLRVKPSLAESSPEFS